MAEDNVKLAGSAGGDVRKVLKPTPPQRRWLLRGLQQPGGKLPLFDENGQQVSDRTVRSCIKNGWAKPWFSNPIKPDWLICKLTESGREILGEGRLRALESE